MAAACIVVAGGSGARLPGEREKQFVSIGGRPILAHTLAAMERSREIGSIVLVVPRGREDVARREIIDAFGFARVAAVVAGGATRAESVQLGLAAVPATTDWVIVHDAVRPFATPALVERVLAGAASTGAAAPAMPIADTVKRVSQGRVVETVDRSGLWVVQTPQAFGQRTLVEAHARANDDPSDCALLVERNGGTVMIVEGEPWNMKITTPADLAFAEALLSWRAA